MGIYDRDYYRNAPSRGGFGHFVAWSVTTWLIVINVAVFFADGVLRFPPPQQQTSVEDDTFDQPPVSPAYRDGLPTLIGEFSIDRAIRRFEVWRFVTYQFLHAYPWHLIMNMLGLYFFGPIVEGHFGARRYLAFYLLCGIAGAAFFSLMAVMRLLSIDPGTPLVGASGSIFGLLVAAAMIAPDVQLFYYFFPVTIRTVAIIAMGLAIYTVLHSGHSPGANAGGEAAHFGGGALGFVLIKNQHWLNFFAPSRRAATYAQRSTRRPRRPRSFQKDWSKDMNR